jgi:hypothetical protein
MPETTQSTEYRLHNARDLGELRASLEVAIESGQSIANLGSGYFITSVEEEKDGVLEIEVESIDGRSAGWTTLSYEERGDLSVEA